MKKVYKNLAIAVVIIALLLGGGIFLYKDLTANEPQSMLVTVYSVSLITDSSGTPVTIFSDPNGIQVDLIGGPLDQFGQGSVPSGTYKRVVLELKNEVTWSGVNPCNSSDNVTGTVRIDENNQDLNAHVQVYFATAEDNGGTGWTHDGSAQAPFLMQSPVVVQPNGTTVVRFVFNVNDTLRCDYNANPHLFPPTLTVVDYPEEPPVCSLAGKKFWFAHFNLSSDPYNPDGSLLQNPTLNDIFQRTAVIAGWGVITFNADGTVTVDPTQTFENQGMAEHRHHLDSYDNSTGEEGYYNPLGGTQLTAEYVMSGNKVFIFMPGGTVMEGAVSADCSTFVGAHIAQIRESDLIYAVEAQSQAQQNLSGKYVFLSPHFDIRYDNTTSNPYRTIGLTPISTLMVFDADAQAGSTTSVEWRTVTDINANDVNNNITGWTTNGPFERVSVDNISLNSFVHIEPDGRLQVCTNDPTCNQPDPFFGAINAQGNGITAGGAEEYDSQNSSSTYTQHYIGTGFLLKLPSSASLADLQGRWYLALLSAEVNDGGDNTWGDGNEQLYYDLNFGEFEISSCGAQTCTVSWSFTRKEVFSGVVANDSGTGTVELAQECYAQGTPISDQTCANGIKIPVFIVKDPSGATVAKLALDTTGQVAAIWAPIDTNDTPEDSAPGCTVPDNQSCFRGATNTISGVAVKIE